MFIFQVKIPIGRTVQRVIHKGYPDSWTDQKAKGIIMFLVSIPSKRLVKILSHLTCYLQVRKITTRSFLQNSFHNLLWGRLACIWLADLPNEEDFSPFAFIVREIFPNLLFCERAFEFSIWYYVFLFLFPY